MKFLSFSADGSNRSSERVGVLRDDDVIDVTEAYARYIENEGCGTPDEVASAVTPPDMLEFLRTGRTALDASRSAVEFVADAPATATEGGRTVRHDPGEITLESPLPRPNTLRDCSLIEEHLLNTRNLEPGGLPAAWYEDPIYYNGNPDAVVAPGTTVEWPSFTEQLDYELELAAVIGRPGRDIPKSRAQDHVFGYMIFNDFSARDLQSRVSTVGLGPGKAKDFANGLGPWLVTEDDFEMRTVRTETRVNGEHWAEETTTGLDDAISEAVADLSEGMPLHPGDVLGTGTVAGGCGLELDRWIQPGDTIELEVDGLGILRHEIGHPTD